MKLLSFVMVGVLSGLCAAEDLPGESLYAIETKWTNQSGKEVQLKDFAGKPVLFSMVYLTCTFSCPTVISQVQSVEEKLAPDQRRKMSVVVLSFDPERDKPAQMKAYMKKRKLDESKWTFLTGKRDSDVREIAAALNFKYEKAEKDFSHSFMILVLDKKGVIQGRIDQANQDKSELLLALTRSLKSP